ncbi:hypothetical protein G9F71_010655 [Clostridium sp. FP2]|uniref:hypothetical protein n=1 Tax=Clostridium sp. FP2 TaxID=2724481 RepID=UPI0013E98D9D|nr:hypothetical protein [Clostridium sp. FP2]MBZ9623310.1 hypothetical protein [Clostridium sp. FP2]
MPYYSEVNFTAFCVAYGKYVELKMGGIYGYSLPIFIGVTMLLFCIEYAIVCFCWEISKVIKEDGLIKGLIQAILLLLFLASIPYFS